jgi:hypothetical protein
MCSDGPGSAPNEIPKGEPFSLSGSKKERKKRRGSGLGKEKGWLLDYIPRPRGARTVRTPSADCPLLLPERPEMHLLSTSHANGPRCPGGQSARSRRMVRPVAVDGPTSFLISA